MRKRNNRWKNQLLALFMAVIMAAASSPASIVLAGEAIEKAEVLAETGEAVEETSEAANGTEAVEETERIEEVTEIIEGTEAAEGVEEVTETADGTEAVEEVTETTDSTEVVEAEPETEEAETEMEDETETETETEMEVETETETETETEMEAETETKTEVEEEPESETDTISGTEAETKEEVSEAETASELESASELETKSETESKTVSDPVTETATVIETETEVQTPVYVSESITEDVEPKIVLVPPEDVIYSDDVFVDVNVKDPSSSGTCSGLKSVTYEVYSLGVLTQSGTLYTYSEESTSAGQSQQSPQQSIVGTVQVYASINNSNEVKIIVYAEDNAGNTSQASVTCQIDTAAPAILVSYDNNSSDTTNRDYFREGRVATITITERNFDPDDVVITIINTEGAQPTVSGWTKHAGTGNGDNTTWTATVEYSADGSYTFAMEYTDEAGNQAGEVIYASGTAAGEAFTIDKTIPAVSVSYDNTDVYNGSYYKGAQTAVITITERGFDSGRVMITATRNGISMQVNPSWSTSGDVHRATVTFEEDAFYTLTVSCTDMAGNESSDNPADSFHVDRTNPQITISGVENESANTGTVMPVITVTDTNYDRNSVAITLEGQRYGEQYTCRTSEVTDGQVFSYVNIEKDDIYVLTVEATDRAGNESAKSVTFSVNREGSTYEISFIEAVNSRYYWKSEDMSNLVFTETNPNRLTDITVTLYRNAETLVLAKGMDYEVAESIGEGGWYLYTYTIYAGVFEEDGIYNIRITSVDEAGNTTQNTLDTKASDIQFVIDNTPPAIAVANLEDGQIENASTYTVQMTVSDNLSLDRIEVYLNDVICKTFTSEEIEEILAENGVFEFDVGESKSAQAIRIVAADSAGNEEETAITDVLITTDVWVRLYTHLPIVVGVIAGIPVAIFVVKKCLRFFAWCDKMQFTNRQESPAS